MKNGAKIGIVGLGLIGGSIAKALIKGHEIAAMSGNDGTLRFALDNGMITKAAHSYEQLFGCDVVFVCTPLKILRQTVDELALVLGNSAIITDVGSVKGILEGANGRIVGGHPMAGTEKCGVINAVDGLFNNAHYILCKMNASTDDYNTVRGLVEEMGAKPIDMNPSEHDKLVAKISHLPHMLAYALAGTVLGSNEEIVGGGLLDTTRIASSSPEFWNSVAELNRDNLTLEMDKFILEFTLLRNKIAASKDITNILRNAKSKRDSIINSRDLK